MKHWMLFALITMGFVVSLQLFNSAKFNSSAKVSKMSDFPLSYGRVGVVSLSKFAGEKSRSSLYGLAHSSFDLLQQEEREKAANAFQAALKDNPYDLAAYVGLMQVKPEMWPNEILRLKAKLAQHPSGGMQPAETTKARSVDTFKLGMLLYYTWRLQAKSERREQDIAYAQELLHQAWHENQQPIMGLMLRETVGFGSPYEERHPEAFHGIIDDLLLQLAGAKAYSLYENAKQKDWQVDPPSTSLVKSINLRPLRGVVDVPWSASGSRGGRRIEKDGHGVIEWEPRTQEQERQLKYFTAWRDALTGAINKQSKK